MKRVILRKLKLAIADGVVKADGKVIYAGHGSARRSVRGGRGAGARLAGRLGGDGAARGVPPRRVHARRHDECEERFADETRGRDRHGGRVLDREQHPGGAGLAARGQVRHRARRPIRRARLSLPGARRGEPRMGADDPAQAAALHGGRHRLELHRHGPGHPRRRAGAGRRRQRAHRHRHGLGRPLHARHRARGRRHAREGPQEGRPLRGAEGHVLGPVGGARHRLPDQGRQLFHLVGLRHLGPLHRQRDRS